VLCFKPEEYSETIEGQNYDKDGRRETRPTYEYKTGAKYTG